MTDPVYVAPARWPFTVLHEKDPSAPAMGWGPGQEATEGETVCGEPMKVAEAWQLLERQPGDRVCLGCAGEGLSEEQGSLL